MRISRSWKPGLLGQSGNRDHCLYLGLGGGCAPSLPTASCRWTARLASCLRRWGPPIPVPNSKVELRAQDRAFAACGKRGQRNGGPRPFHAKSEGRHRTMTNEEKTADETDLSQAGEYVAANKMTVEQRLAIRKKAGLQIDPETAVVELRYTLTSDRQLARGYFRPFVPKLIEKMRSVLKELGADAPYEMPRGSRRLAPWTWRRASGLAVDARRIRRLKRLSEEQEAFARARNMRPARSAERSHGRHWQ